MFQARERAQWFSASVAVAVFATFVAMAAPIPTLSDLRSPAYRGKFLPVPPIRQSRNFTCGAAAVQSVLAYFGEDFREAQLERVLATDPYHGTSVEKIVAFWKAMGDAQAQRALRALSGKAELESVTAPDSPSVENPPVRFNFRLFGKREWHDAIGPPAPDCPRPNVTSAPIASAWKADEGWPGVKRAADRGWPVIVALQAGALSPADYVGVRWDSGHYAVVVGYDADRVYFMDPMVVGRYVQLSHAAFRSRWYDYDGPLSPTTGERCPGGHRLYRFGIAVGIDAPSRYRWSQVLPME